MMIEKYTVVILFMLYLLMVGFFLIVHADPYIEKNRRRVFLVAILLIIVLVTQNYMGYYLELRGDMPFARTINSICGYSIRPLILLMFCYTVEPDRKHGGLWLLICINMGVHLTALFSDICFAIDDANNFRRGTLGYTSHAISAIMLVVLLWLSVKKYVTAIGISAIILVLNALIVVLSVILDSVFVGSEWPMTFLTAAIVSCSIFYYIWMHLQFVSEHEKDLMSEQRIRIMMSQIQPHFLYNTIATFKALCKKDPQKAADVADKFGIYLRQNMDSLDVVGCIPFDRELEHTQCYADIEMVRFENIRVEYDIEDRDFMVPPLTLQPLVENAIRHGVRIRDEGIVRVTTRRRDTHHEITIEDNGVGFEPSSLETMSGSHIGLKNVKERVEKMCQGELFMDSVVGRGTKITIKIPVEEPATAKPCGIPCFLTHGVKIRPIESDIN